MKKQLKLILSLFAVSLLFSSCYSYTSVVGNGAQGNSKTTKWNHYLVYGLAPVGVSDSKEMDSGSDNYEVTTRITFVNYICAWVTFGLYAPTSTKVKNN